MSLPTTSFRGRLIVAFAAVIAVSLLLASSAFALLLRDYQSEREKDRLEALAILTTGQVIRSMRNGMPLPEIEGQLDQTAAAAAVRVLLVSDRGLVVHDTDQDRLVNRVLPPLPGRRAGVQLGTVDDLAGEQSFVVVPPGLGGYRVAVVAPERSLTNAWRDLLPRLSLAAVAALLVSIAVAWWLAATVTRPIAQITRASEAMARGQYDQRVPVPAGGDEVARVATAFNAMAREVARSHRAMRDLLANVSHDLRTPLTSIQGFAGALVDGTLRGEQGAREAGRVIAEESERMSRLVEDLLYLGRIEAGEVALDREPVDLADLAQAARRRFAFRAEEASVALSVDATCRPIVRGDAHRLAQALDNFLDNALKHTPAGGHISITVDGGEPGTGEPIGAVARLAVHNSGSFIPPDELERVFERFYQTDPSRTSGVGRGLGLAIAREIVQAHAGTIRVTSALDSGTSFEFQLPRIGDAALIGLSCLGSPEASADGQAAPPRSRPA